MQLTDKGLIINIDDKTQYFSEIDLKAIIKSSAWAKVKNVNKPIELTGIFVNSPNTNFTYEEYRGCKNEEMNNKVEEIKVEEKPNDMVNNPSHYGGKHNPYEAIKVIEAWNLGFNLGNTVKYISRAGKKDALLQELQKASWYLNREIENLKKK